MTSGLAAKLTIHDPEVIGVDPSEGQATLVPPTPTPTPGPPPLRIVEGGERLASGRRRREGLRRLLLCGADVFAAAAAMVLVLTVLGDNRLKLLTLAGTPLVVVFFKVAGLYDREQLRLLRSTLDEVPALVQVAGLYALTMAILQPHVVAGHLWGGQIAALWLTSFIAILARPHVRPLGGRTRVRDRALPGDRRRRARTPHPRETQQQPRPCRRRRDSAARGKRDRSPRRTRRRSAPRR